MTYTHATTYVRVDQGRDGITLRKQPDGYGDSVTYGLEIMPPHNYRNYSDVIASISLEITHCIQSMIVDGQISPDEDSADTIYQYCQDRDITCEIADSLVPGNAYHRHILIAEAWQDDIWESVEDALDAFGWCSKEESYPDDFNGHLIYSHLRTLADVALEEIVSEIGADNE